MALSGLKKELKAEANPEKAKILQKFFKTGPDQYGAGDVFLGVTASKIRKITKKYHNLGLADVIKLLHSKIHEERVASLRIMIDRFQKGKEKGKIYRTYLKNAKWVNNWDLVDMSADKIAGDYLFDKSKSILYKLAKSKNLWERRIAVMATFNFIKKNEFEETFKIVEILLNDDHDLIHKAIGWMLREIGKRNLKAEENFLKKHCKKMARTALRYAIEKFPEKKRKQYLLSGKI
jgi:3-methyladenine DNA glycosylase AlkD